MGCKVDTDVVLQKAFEARVESGEDHVRLTKPAVDFTAFSAVRRLDGGHTLIAEGGRQRVTAVVPLDEFRQFISGLSALLPSYWTVTVPAQPGAPPATSPDRDPGS